MPKPAVRSPLGGAAWAGSRRTRCESHAPTPFSIRRRNPISVVPRCWVSEPALAARANATGSVRLSAGSIGVAARTVSCAEQRSANRTEACLSAGARDAGRLTQRLGHRPPDVTRPAMVSASSALRNGLVSRGMSASTPSASAYPDTISTGIFGRSSFSLRASSAPLMPGIR